MKDKNGTEIKEGDEVNVLVHAVYRRFNYAVRYGERDNTYAIPADAIGIVEVTRVAPKPKPGQIYRLPNGTLWGISQSGTQAILLRMDNGCLPPHLMDPFEINDANRADWELVVDAP